MRFVFLLTAVMGCGASEVCVGGLVSELPAGELLSVTGYCDSVGVSGSADVSGVARRAGWVFSATTESDVARVQVLLVDPASRLLFPVAVKRASRDYVETHELARIDEGGALQEWQIYLDQVGRTADQMADVSTVFGCDDAVDGVIVRVNSYADDGAMFDCAIGGEGSAAYWAEVDSSDCWCVDGPTGCGVGGSHDPGLDRLPSDGLSPVGGPAL